MIIAPDYFTKEHKAWNNNIYNEIYKYDKHIVKYGINNI